MKPEELMPEIKRLGNYAEVRQLDDGSIAAIGKLMFTTAIYLGCNLYGWDRRFCFQDSELAAQQFGALRSEEDQPCGWIARRPEARS